MTPANTRGQQTGGGPPDPRWLTDEALSVLNEGLWILERLDKVMLFYFLEPTAHSELVRHVADIGALELGAWFVAPMRNECKRQRLVDQLTGLMTSTINAHSASNGAASTLNELGELQKALQKLRETRAVRLKIDHYSYEKLSRSHLRYGAFALLEARSAVR